jgi:hypothetical protein
LACGVIVTDNVPNGVLPAVEAAVPDSGPAAAGRLAVFNEALAPENKAVAE